ncbi:group 3 secretory phospholipase A2 [Lepisosteus oculatus]|uniref:group 3 secretory phospholipase A2 n=1 Tax=Lepisosteus oculatus TaxID=7918 RepID=UPI0035F51722
MQIRSELLLALFVVFGSVSVVFAEDDVIRSETAGESLDFCYLIRRSASRPGHMYYSFLRRTHFGSLLLYQSTWTEGQRLADCAASGDKTLTDSYWSLCRAEGRSNFSSIPDPRIDTSLLFGPGSPCVTKPVMDVGGNSAQRAKRDLETLKQGHTAASSPSETPRRKKRGWFIPGTLWCGTGTSAATYGDLGVFEETDTCCREHDQCENTISSFQINFGVFNHNLFTVSHCECDRRFRQCLLGVNDTVSNLVGYGFFNVLKVPCFVFEPKLQCVQMYWWGGCKSSKIAPFATFQKSVAYNSTHPAEEEQHMGWWPQARGSGVHGNSTSTPAPPAGNTTTGKPAGRPQPARKCRPKHRHKSKTVGDLNAVTDKERDGARPKGSKRSKAVQPEPPLPACRRPGRPPAAAGTPSAPRADDAGGPAPTSTLSSGGGLPLEQGFENALPTLNPWASPSHPRPGGAALNHPEPVQDVRERRKWQSCNCYKHLDQCKYKIGPQEVKFSLKNPEPKTLYHCNCTRRMARRVGRLSEWNAVESLLSDYVAMSCFQLQQTENCMKQEGCVAVLSRATHLKRVLKDRRTITEGAPKVKRRSARPAKSKAIPRRLYSRCLRIIDSKKLRE